MNFDAQLLQEMIDYIQGEPYYKVYKLMDKIRKALEEKEVAQDGSGHEEDLRDE